MCGFFVTTMIRGNNQTWIIVYQ